MTMARLLGAEVAIILAASAVLTLLLLRLAARCDEPLVRARFVR